LERGEREGAKKTKRKREKEKERGEKEGGSWDNSLFFTRFFENMPMT
jgi:hypothetical protein